MIKSEKLNKILINIDSYTQEKAIWIAKPLYECSVSSRKEDLGCYFSYHFEGDFTDKETREYLSPQQVQKFLCYQFAILDNGSNLLATGWSSCKNSIAPLTDFFKYKKKEAIEINYFAEAVWK